ncbi:hypothetical protein [Enterovirga rhinocerotis]|uniref:Immunity protein 50 of polymorphic toxin system n=1 Tax=Enterovirga rhinocerotis TaxID=1339210 RepID=A0A4V3DYZ6_9HYPH|nr:hypothetical protein [Enterovirga rhinocerotis]TDR94549.1 hypothetical protein EV668_1837 [Enterovirga rhinocerotis]
MSVFHDVPGGAALVDWFGHAPRFHDAVLLEIGFASKGRGMLRIHAWTMTDAVDAEGHFILDKHAVVTLALQDVSRIDCTDFDMVPGIIFDLSISQVDEHFHIEWNASYGIVGSIRSKQMEISFRPGKPDQVGGLRDG